MSYDPDIQYRCAIIRGRAKNAIDDLLLLYAQIIESLCPIDVREFNLKFNQGLERYLPGADKKAIDNHRTEIAGKLFGMYYVENGVVELSETTERLLETSDQPAFFKDMCFKLQFPNGMERADTIKEKMANQIHIRPCVLILQILHEVQSMSFEVTIEDIGYYALNSLHALQGKASPKEIAKRIYTDKNKGIKKEIDLGGKEASYAKQHIRELFNYLELANLVQISGKKATVKLNNLERMALKAFLKEPANKLLFDVYEYEVDAEIEDDENTESNEKIKLLREDYSKFFSYLSFKNPVVFVTPEAALASVSQMNLGEINPETAMEIGDLGEKIVFNYERRRIEGFNSRYIGKVLSLGKTRGLGYDVQSVWGEGPNPGHSIYIEVKSTKRATPPSGNNPSSVTLTRNEWLMAEQQKESYFIYRVCFTNEGVYLTKFNDIVAKSVSGEVFAEPTHYRMDFNDNISPSEKIE